MERNLVSCSCNCHKRQPFVDLAPATNLYTEEETLRQNIFAELAQSLQTRTPKAFEKWHIGCK